MIPISLASFLGPVLLGKYFDVVGRRKMMFITYLSSGMLLVVTALLFGYDVLSLQLQSILWFLVFLIASPAASSAHLTISELFPITMRLQAMAFFFSISLFIGGVASPLIFSKFIAYKDKYYVSFAYIISASLMIFSSFIVLIFGVDAENKSLE